LTWLRKCAKEQGHDEKARQIAIERADLKHKTKGQFLVHDDTPDGGTPLQREALRCRTLARQFALSSGKDDLSRERLQMALDGLSRFITRYGRDSYADDDLVLRSARTFHATVSGAVDSSNPTSVRGGPAAILQACDDLRDNLRAQGVQVNDAVSRKSKK